jgi:mannose-6-phosphate isomerase-like protein (cupin superfamily)
VPDSYTLKNLMDVKDGAPGFGLGDVQEARFPSKDLATQQVGLSHQRIKPGVRVPFAHRHDEAEEVYVVLAGSGRVKLDDEIVELDAMDALRVAPPVTRSFEAGPDGLDLLVFGQHHEKDGEIIQGWWSD